MIEELKCRNCGSPAISKKDGVWICENCGSKFISSSGEEDKIPYYISMAETAAENHKYGKMNEYALKILAIDPQHAYAWLMRMYYYGTKKDEKNTQEIIDAGNKAVKFAGEDMETIDSVYKAYLDWADSSMFYFNSRTNIFKDYYTPEKWNKTITRTEEKIKESYWDYCYLARRYFDYAVMTLKEVDVDYLNRKMNEMEKYREILYDAEQAALMQYGNYKRAGFDNKYEDDIRIVVRDLTALWEKIGVSREDQIMKELSERYPDDYRYAYDYVPKSVAKNKVIDSDEERSNNKPQKKSFMQRLHDFVNRT